MQHKQHSTRTALGFVFAATILLLAVASGGIAWGAPPQQGTVPPPTETVVPIPVTGAGNCCLPGIVFATLRDGNSEIYAMKADGSSVYRLTNHAAVDEHPAGSFDGRRVVFSTNRDDPDPSTCGSAGKPNCMYNLYVMNVDGTDQRRLTTGKGHDGKSVWSASGAWIAFASTLDDPSPQTCGQSGKPACVQNIYVMSTDGRTLKRLTASVPGKPTASNWDPSWSPDDTRIAFVSNRDGNNEIYLINVDGSGLVRLTNNAAADSYPAWSPDGSQLAFETNRDGRYQLYVVNANGTGTRRVTQNSGDDRYPVWLPGCTDRIVYASNRDGGPFRIYVIDPDGSNAVRLTTLPAGSTVVDHHPSWSGLPEPLRPVGACCVPGIAFDSVRDGNEEIYIMLYDGSKLTRLTVNPARDLRPAPAPDGARIAFESNRSGRFQIWVIGVDGSGAYRLTTSTGDDTQPAWSLDNLRLAFVSNRDGKDRIYAMNADGSGVVRLTNPATGTDSNPSWVSGNKRVLFQSNRDGNDEVYVTGLDGAVTRLTNDPAVDGHPASSPDGKWIAFESNRTGKYQIYVMNMDGTGVKQITQTGENRRPNWCPSCDDRIVFESNRDGAGFKIYATNSDGSNQVRLTSQMAGAPAAASDDNPAWSGLPLQFALPANLSGVIQPGGNK